MNTANVPVFVAATTLVRYANRDERFPVRGFTTWAGDSGAYSALMLAANSDRHPWSKEDDEYGSMWVDFTECIGTPPDFIAPQDWPCEPTVRLRTGLSVRDHQEMTLDSYLHLAEEFYFLPWLPVLQGWRPEEYLTHAEMYRAAGVDLRGRRVGIGSVCRRGSQTGILRVFEALAPLGMKMHGFGVSLNGLRLAAHLLDSSDSQAHSLVARHEGIRLDGCTHVGKDGQPSDCRNCLAWALAYRDRITVAVEDNRRAQLARPTNLLDLLGGAA